MTIKKMVFIYIFLCTAHNFFAESTKSTGKFHIIPIVGYGVVNFTNQRISTPTTGIICMQNSEHKTTTGDSLLLAAMYKQTRFGNPIPDLDMDCFGNDVRIPECLRQTCYRRTTNLYNRNYFWVEYYTIRLLYIDIRSRTCCIRLPSAFYKFIDSGITVSDDQILISGAVYRFVIRFYRQSEFMCCF